MFTSSQPASVFIHEKRTGVPPRRRSNKVNAELVELPVMAKNVLQVLAFFNTTRNAILQARQALQYMLERPAALQLLLLLCKFCF
jgi:hypothetical protein